MRIVSLGHAAYAETLIALGMLGMLSGQFTAIEQPVPENLPARELLVYLSALISLASGAGLLWKRTQALAARAFLAFALTWLLAIRVPAVILAPSVNTSWACSKTAVMAAAAWVLYVWFAADTDKRRLAFATGDSGTRIARALYGLALIPFGIAHFLYLQQTVVLVPAWLPSPVAWAYLTGAALIAAGIGILANVFARLAAALSALEMGAFVILVWVPIVSRGHVSEFHWIETIVSVALTSAAWVVADSYRGRPWLSPR